MSQKSLVVGFDSSEQSRFALDFAKVLAHKYDAKLNLLHVIDWSPFEFHTWEENEAQSKVRKDEIKRDREKLFPPILDELKAADIEAERFVLFGHPAEMLADFAEEHQALAIVVGRRGQSRLKRVLFGSVASALIGETRTPVVIVP